MGCQGGAGLELRLRSGQRQAKERPAPGRNPAPTLPPILSVACPMGSYLPLFFCVRAPPYPTLPYRGGAARSREKALTTNDMSSDLVHGFQQNIAGRILGEIYMRVIATQGGLKHPGVCLPWPKILQAAGDGALLGPAMAPVGEPLRATAA